MDVHVTRRQNLLVLFSEFVAESQRLDNSAPLVGLEMAFAERLQIANSSLSSYKSGRRPIGPRIARQIESLLQLERGWMDTVCHEGTSAFDEVELNSFIKLATRFFKRSSPVQRQLLTDMFKLGLNKSKDRADD